MSSTHEGKSSDKQRQRSRKAGQRDQKAGQQRNPKPDQRNEDQIDSMVALTDVPASRAADPAAQSLIGEAEPAELVEIADVAAASASPTEATASAGERFAVNIQTIANAYRDYTRKSFQENMGFVEKLMGVRSLDKAVEVQTDYARQAYANFVAESQRICGLYSQLATQTFMPRQASRLN